MNFLSPLYLLGLICLVIPIAIHLYFKRRSKRVAFPTLRFLKLSQKQKTPGLKLRRILLLVARTLALFAFILGFAKPQCDEEQRHIGSNKPTTYVVLIDNSLSMGTREWWTEARSQLESRIGSMNSWDEVILLESTKPVGNNTLTLPVSPTDAIPLLSQLGPQSFNGDLQAAIFRAGQLLKKSNLSEQHLIIVSDFVSDSLPTLPSNEHTISFIKASGDDSKPNVAMTSLDVKVEDFQTGRVNISITIENFSNESIEDIELIVELDTVTIIESRVSLTENESKTLNFNHQGANFEDTLNARIDHDTDSNKLDNVRFYALKELKRKNVLIINGAPSVVAENDETFFLRRALDTSQTTPARYSVVSPKGASTIVYDEYDIVVIANTVKLSADESNRLKEFVSAGGGLLITLGSNLEPDRFNALFKDLSPRQLRGTKSRTSDELSSKPSDWNLEITQSEHPTVVGLTENEQLNQVQISTIGLVEPNALGTSDTILSLKNATPLLMERRIGKGRVLLWSTSMDIDWTDLPLRPAFVPLFDQMIRYLSHEQSLRSGSGLLAGATLDDLITNTSDIDKLKVTTPSGAVTTVNGKDASKLVLDASGIYTIETPTRIYPRAINPDISDSNLRPRTIQEVRDHFGKDSAPESIQNARPNWEPFFVLLVTMLLIESLLTLPRLSQPSKE